MKIKEMLIESCCNFEEYERRLDRSDFIKAKTYFKNALNAILVYNKSLEDEYKDEYRDRD